MHAVSSAEVEVRPDYVAENGTYAIADYIGSVGEAGDQPQAFLVDFRPSEGGVISPHFHEERQFQVVVGGDGRIGKLEVPPVTFHYADPFTPYGPIVPKDGRIVFFTLRPTGVTGAHRMPGSKDKLERRAGRNVARQLESAPLPADGAREDIVIERSEDGLAAFRLLLAPGETIEGPSADGSGGQYYLVTEGALVHEGRDLPPNSLLYVGPDEAPPTLTAGAGGCGVLVMQFPVD